MSNMNMNIKIQYPKNVREISSSCWVDQKKIGNSMLPTFTKKVVKYLEKISIPVKGEMIDQVATISANNDKELGELIGGAFKSVGDTGVVIMEESKDLESSVKIIDGMQYEKPLKSLHFATDKVKGIAELKKPLVLVVESKIENIRKIQGVLEHAIRQNESLFIIADVDPQVLAALAMNKMKGNIKVCIVDAPTYGFTKKEKLNDLALMTGATVINAVSYTHLTLPTILLV